MTHFNDLINLDPDLNYFSVLDEFSADSLSKYVTIGEYNSKKPEPQYLSIVNYNVRSFAANSDAFLASFNSNNLPDIFVFCETMFNKDHQSEIPGYIGYHVIRENCLHRSGGVSVFIKNSIVSEKVDRLSYANLTLELCTVKLNFGGENWFILGLYRPHSDTIQNFSSVFHSILESGELLHKNFIVLGDLNIDMLKENSDTELFAHMMSTFHLFPLITKPTRFSPLQSQVPSLLDHIWLNKLTNFKSGILTLDFTDHCPIYCDIFISKKNCQPDKKIKIEFRSMDESNHNHFIDLISNFEFSSLSSSDIDQYVQSFLTKLNHLYQTAFPIKQKFVSQKFLENPWITSNIKKLIKMKSTFFSLLRKGLISRADNNHFKNKVKFIIDRAKKDYYKNLFEHQSGNIVKTWKLINKLTSNNISNVNIKSIFYNNIEYTDNESIANLFNEFFVSVARELDENLPTTDIDPLMYVRPNSSSFSLTPVTHEECSKIILNLNNTSHPINEIPVSIFKKYSCFYIQSVCDMINKSFTSGIFPSPLKLARVIPIFKSGDKTNLSNYRPISMLNTLSKIFENCLYNRLISFFETNTLISTNQFGFRRNRSTADAILKVTEFINNALDNRDISMGVFIDFSKAFDCINHGILLRKLECYGVRGVPLDLLSSYISNRAQHVCINGCTSGVRYARLGVPQGSVLGPLLFLIYINDLCNIPSNFLPVLFADDTTLCLRNAKISNLISSCNFELQKFYDWTIANRLTINLEKTYFIIFTNKNLNCVTFDITINDTRIEKKDSGKFLGITLDNKLNYSLHIKEIGTKISRSIGIMYKLQNLVSASTLRIIYYSLIYSYLNYCISIWGGTYRCHLRPLEVLQKRALRIMCNVPGRSHTEPLFKSNNLLKLTDVYNYNLAIHLYKNSLHAEFMRDHNHNTRNRSNLLPVFHRLTSTQNSFSYNAPTLWNTLPIAIQEARNIDIFKSSLKRYFLSQYQSSS